MPCLIVQIASLKSARNDSFLRLIRLPQLRGVLSICAIAILIITHASSVAAQEYIIQNEDKLDQEVREILSQHMEKIRKENGIVNAITIIEKELVNFK